MATSTFSGPLKSGTVKEGSSANLGHAVLTQTGSTTHADGTALVQDITFYLPPNSQLIDVIPDVQTAYDSATSATLTVGTASGGSEYVGSVNAKTAGRATPTISAAQAAAMADIGTNTTVVATVTSVGDPTAGEVRVTLVYAQK